MPVSVRLPLASVKIICTMAKTIITEFDNTNYYDNIILCTTLVCLCSSPQL